MKNLYFDEAGFTGNNLIDIEQPFFCYLGVDTNELIEQQFLEIKKSNGYSIQECKGTKLFNSTKGQKVIRGLWEIVGDRAKYVIHNKKHALAAKIFEYVYEPVFADNNSVLYSIGFHRFIANYFYTGFMLKDISAEAIFSSFQKFIMNKKVDNYLDLLGDHPGEDHPLFYFYKFCLQYKKEIASDVDFTTPGEQWLLDLTMTSLYNLLGAFAEDGSEELQVTCDKSKPLAASKELINTFINDQRVLYTDLFGHKARLNFNLKKEIVLADSKDTISLQIADILVSSIANSVKNYSNKFSKEVLDFTNKNFVYSTSVLPVDMLKEYSPYEFSVYREIMIELAKRKSKSKKLERVIGLGNYMHFLKTNFHLTTAST